MHKKEMLYLNQLTYQTLRDSGYTGYVLENAPVRVLQFGEGNFLRAFADCFIDIANEICGWNTKVTVVQPIALGLADIINRQQGLYTLYLQGFAGDEEVNSKRVISCIKDAINPYEDFGALLAAARNPMLRYVVSNTTEAGIVYDASDRFENAPPGSFPAKLCRCLHERYAALGGKDSGVVILSCELIDHNGDELKRCVNEYAMLWNLETGFISWLNGKNLFCNTLVDRIVTGYPRREVDMLNAKNGYEDKLLDAGEIFGLWIIEGPQWLAEELPFAKAGLPVKVVTDHTPYKLRKVRILNGAHTSMALAAYLTGQNTVRESMEDSQLLGFMENTLRYEIIPTLTLPQDELTQFATDVISRFKNPFIDHRLLDIALNSTSKWRARILPTLKGYVAANKKLPPRITFSFAAYIRFYRSGRLTDEGLVGLRNGEEYLIKDDRPVLEFFREHCNDDAKTIANAVCVREDFWGEDLSTINGFAEQVAVYLEAIGARGIPTILNEIV
jgi:tagaturonate reductase